jgi:hypothetical protein
MSSYFSDFGSTAANYDRASDLAILLGHAMQCEMCRDRLLAAPERAIPGRKMSAEQRERLLQLSFEDFESIQLLAAAAGLSSQELAEGIEHPRARLRHL